MTDNSSSRFNFCNENYTGQQTLLSLLLLTYLLITLHHSHSTLGFLVYSQFCLTSFIFQCFDAVQSTLSFDAVQWVAARTVACKTFNISNSVALVTWTRVLHYFWEFIAVRSITSHHQIQNVLTFWWRLNRPVLQHRPLKTDRHLHSLTLLTSLNCNRHEFYTRTWKALLQFPFSALTLLVGRHEGYPACIKLGVGLLLMTIWLELCMSYSFSCHHHFHHPIKSRLETFWYQLN